ncbi:hypothetical protein C621_0218055 [Bacillus thuringiensis serovar aizawai str. Leapi01]|nr:hypothetical protein C621_0218055 [Bacillus thuringiensis serovar aizawai str. Leapi01]
MSHSIQTIFGKQLMKERGISMAHITIMRRFINMGRNDERVWSHFKTTNDSRRVDETYIKMDVSIRAVDSEYNTIDLYFSETRDTKNAKRFFKKAFWPFHVSKPRIITVDKNPAYPIAIEQ